MAAAQGIEEHRTGGGSHFVQASREHIDVGAATGPDGARTQAQVAGSADVGQFVCAQVRDQPGITAHQDQLARIGAAAHHTRQTNASCTGQLYVSGRLQGLAVTHGQRTLCRFDVHTACDDVALEAQVSSAGAELEQAANRPVIAAGPQLHGAADTAIELGDDGQISVTGCRRAGRVHQTNDARRRAAAHRINAQGLDTAADGGAAEQHGRSLDICGCLGVNVRQRSDRCAGGDAHHLSSAQLSQRERAAGAQAQVAARAQGRTGGHGDAGTAQIEREVTRRRQHTGEDAATAAANANGHTAIGAEVIDACRHHIQCARHIRCKRGAQAAPKAHCHGAGGKACAASLDRHSATRGHVTLITQQTVLHGAGQAVDGDITIQGPDASQRDVALGAQQHTARAVGRGQGVPGHVERST